MFFQDFPVLENVNKKFQDIYGYLSCSLTSACHEIPVFCVIPLILILFLTFDHESLPAAESSDKCKMREKNINIKCHWSQCFFSLAWKVFQKKCCSWILSNPGILSTTINNWPLFPVQLAFQSLLWFYLLHVWLPSNVTPSSNSPKS